MLEIWDWAVIVGFLLLIVSVGLSFTKKASKNLTNFFLGGRNLPWYVLGVSMVATTFAADTPLAVTELVSQNGISGNWLWWNMLAGGMLTTFFFANLWRRADVMTEVQLIEMRYSGKPAAFLRGFKAIYLGVFMNILIIGWVNVALISILEVFFEISRLHALEITAVFMLLVAIYSSLSGFLGVAITDVIQFVIAMVACIVMAVLVVNSDAIGGITGLKTKLPESALSFFPSVGGSGGTAITADKFMMSALGIAAGAFFAQIAMQWWASWYPGAEPGGGGYIAQRMMSAKNEKHAVYATLFFQIAHYCIRPWPWIVVALCTLVLYNVNEHVDDASLKSEIVKIQEVGKFNRNIFTKTTAELQEMAKEDENVATFLVPLTNINTKLAAAAKENPKLEQALVYSKEPKKGFVFVMKDFLPTGLKGLLLVAFFAAYMSTISTQLNWGASYIVNDVYHRFMNEAATQQQLIRAARASTLLLMGLGLGAAMVIESISGVWSFIIECGAGLGMVLILRWYWWRINAWSEIAATIAPFVAYGVSRFVLDIQYPTSFFLTVGFTTVVWLLVTFFTKPTDMKVLQNFYQKVRPDGNWGPVKHLSNQADKPSQIWSLIICWLSAVAMTYAILFAMGKLVFMDWPAAFLWIAAATISFVVLKIALSHTNILDN
ncbi:MAG: sodium:solute symporter family protein [Chitinophagales bacterium]